MYSSSSSCSFMHIAAGGGRTTGSCSCVVATIGAEGLAASFGEALVASFGEALVASFGAALAATWPAGLAATTGCATLDVCVADAGSGEGTRCTRASGLAAVASGGGGGACGLTVTSTARLTGTSSESLAETSGRSGKLTVSGCGWRGKSSYSTTVLPAHDLTWTCFKPCGGVGGGVAGTIVLFGLGMASLSVKGSTSRTWSQ